MISLAQVVTLSAILFSIGVAGVLCRRNALVIFMSIELMLNAANLALIGFSRFHGGMEGQAVAFFVIVLAAVEAAVGLAVILAVFRKQGTVDLSEIRFLRG